MDEPPISPAFPLPGDPRHQRVADLYLSGRPGVDAYLEAGFKCTRESAYQNAKRVLKRPDVVAYMDAVKAAAAEAAVMSVREKREYLARVVRVPITSLDPEKEENGDLIKSFSKTESELSNSFRVEKVDPIAAIKLDNELASVGNPQADAVGKLAEAIASLGSASPLPEDRM
jgi:DNA-directed RNA polymerase subunit F